LGVGLKEGQLVEIGDREFKIARIMPEFGEQADIQLVMDLHDAQQVLGKPGRINQILALNCKCKGNRLSVIRAELEGVLPETKVTEQKTNADAREKQRDLVEVARKQQLEEVQANLQRVEENRERQHASGQQQVAKMSRLIAVITPLAVLASALFVGLLTWLNVRERQPEIGVLRALGKSAWDVAALFFGKAMLLGLIGGAAGCLLGWWLSPLVGRVAMELDPALFRVDPRLIAAALAGAPLVAVLASYLPTLLAVSQDPAQVLADN
jgi:putative ABC transport system permease protein